MKTKEELETQKIDVLAFIHRLCEGSGASHELSPRLTISQEDRGYTCMRRNLAGQRNQVFQVSATMDAADPYWEIAYCVLGLNTLNAVEAERAKTNKCICACAEFSESVTSDMKAKMKGLKQSCEAEVAKSAKMYDALNVAQAEIRTLYPRLGYLDGGTALTVIDEAMEAYNTAK